MQSLSHQPPAAKQSPPDPALEVERLGALLDERRAELTALQTELRDFKVRYTHVVGSRLAELAEVEREIREAETRALGLEPEEEDEGEAERAASFYAPSASASGGVGLKRLFWSVARLFHPDHASDEGEARRRHSIMAEASRAYREGDVDSLHTLLGDEHLQSFCATASREDEPEDLAARLLNLKEELRTIEFGIKRARQDGLYQLMLKTRAEAAEGRDALAAVAQSLARQIAKARRRLEHFS